MEMDWRLGGFTDLLRSLENPVFLRSPSLSFSHESATDYGAGASGDTGGDTTTSSGDRPQISRTHEISDDIECGQEFDRTDPDGEYADGESGEWAGQRTYNREERSETQRIGVHSHAEKEGYESQQELDGVDSTRSDAPSQADVHGADSGRGGVPMGYTVESSGQGGAQQGMPTQINSRPWKQRFRYGVIPDYRQPCASRKSPLESAMRRSGDRNTRAVVAPEIGMEFDSLPEAYDFFNLYSWEIGFGIRYGPSRRNPAKSKTGQDIICGCAGRPRHANARSVSCGCQVMIRLHRTSDHGWYIHEFRSDHNHGLSVTCGEKMHWSSHKNIDPHTKSIVKNLRDNSVGLTKVFSVIGSFFGSMENVPFNKRSLKNLCASISRDHSDDDVKKTCELFSELKREDPNFVDSVLCDKDGKIRALMWTNGKSRMQYKSFGDAITFDTTYKTNQYQMPFGLFVGVNNHFQSIILGGVLMTNEDEESFKWVFNEFSNLMGGKAPGTILTDQCRAMELAIAAVWPGTIHRWCKWHILRRAKECLGAVYSKNSAFRDQLHKIIEYMLTIEEFEDAWNQLIAEHGLHDHPFLTQIFDIRSMWAKPYFAGVFCARMTSTQRSESANHMLKTHTNPGCSMNMFVRHYQKLQFNRDAEENFQERRSRLKGVVLSSGGPIETHASKVYTPAMYELFGVALFQAASYTVDCLMHGLLYVVTHVEAEKREKWSRVSFKVEVQDDGEYVHCECGMYEHMGMLCCHAIRVMMHLNYREIPKRHIMRRWTRFATVVLPDHLLMYQEDSPALLSTSFRHTALYRTAVKLVQLGDSNPPSFEVAMDGMLKTMPLLAQTSLVKDGLSLEERLHAEELDEQVQTPEEEEAPRGSDRNSVRLRANMVAPFKRKDLGRPTSARAKPMYEVSRPRTKFCSMCKSRNHFANSCPMLKRMAKNPRKKPTCSKCGLVGHRSNTCR